MPTYWLRQFIFREDQTIMLDIDVSGLASSLTDIVTSYVISGVPSDAALSAGVLNSDGSYSLDQNDLTGLALALGANSAGNIQLGITATIQQDDGNGNLTTLGSTSSTLILPIDAVADDITISVNDIYGWVGDQLPLDITTSLIDQDGSESIGHVVISGTLPTDSTLSAGYVLPDGSRLLVPDDLVGLTISSTSSDFAELTITVVTQEQDPETGVITNVSESVNIDYAITEPMIVSTYPVVVEPEPIILDIIAETPTLDVTLGIPEFAGYNAKLMGEINTVFEEC